MQHLTVVILKGIFYDLKISKAVMKKIGLARKYTMIKYRTDWPEPEIQHSRQVKVRSLMSGICASDLHQINVNVSYAASILARASFLSWFVHQTEVGDNLPRGAGEKAEGVLRKIIKTKSPDLLNKIAKMHFKSVKKNL